MLRENIKWKNHKIESTNVVNRDRLNRSSEEVSVMEMERRDLRNNGLSEETLSVLRDRRNNGNETRKNSRQIKK